MIEEIFSAYHSLTKPLQNAKVKLHLSSLDDVISPKHDSDSSVLLGDTNLLYKLKDIWASHFSHDYLRSLQDFPDTFPTGNAVIIQNVVDADASGILYTVNPFTNDKSQLVIEAVFGDAVALKMGTITPDRYEVNKEGLIINSLKTSQQTVAYKKTESGVKEVLLSVKTGKEQKVSSLQILFLSEIGKKIEQIFLMPQEITWAFKDINLSY